MWGNSTTPAGLLVIAPQIARQQAEFLAVLGDGASGDGDALFVEFRDELLIAERSGFVLHVDQVGDHLLHAGVGDGSTAIGLITGGEEILEVEHAVRRADVLVGDRAAHRGFMDADDVCDLRHRERLQGRDAGIEELLLGVDDLAGDALDRPLALLNRVDEELSGAHPLPQVIALVLGKRALGDQVAVSARDAEARDVVAVEDDLPLLAVPFDGDIGDDDAIVVLGEPPAGRGIEFANFLDGGLHVVGIGAQLAGEFRNPAPGQQFEVIADHACREGAAAALGDELGQQAIRQVVRADARRFERAQDLERGLDGFERNAGLEGDVGRGLREKAAVIQTAHEVPHGLDLLRRQVAHVRLLHQVLLQRGLAHERIEEMLPAFRVLGGVGLRAADAGHVIAPVLIEFAEDLEFLVLREIEFLALPLALGILPRWRGFRRLAGIARFRAAVVVRVFGRLVETHPLHGELFERRIALQLLLDHGAEIERRHLKNFQGVPQLGRQNQRLGLALPQILAKSGPAHEYDGEWGSSQTGVRRESEGMTGSRTPNSPLR